MSMIDTNDLRLRLARAAQVRSLVTMLSGVLLMFPVGACLGPQPDDLSVLMSLFIWFGGFLVVSWLMTKFYCRPKVTCPACGTSLWSCGTGNFKPRRMKVRKDATACPGCHTPIL